MEDFIFENMGKIVVALIIVAAASVPIVGDEECRAKTENMGFNYEWTFFGGCRIEHKDGVWIPLERYRVIEDE